MNISDVAKRSRLPASTLRYYEEKGLIKSIGREGLKRVYPPDILTTLALIVLAQHAGFSLDEIGTLLFGAEKHINRNKLLEKAEVLDKQIAQMTAMRDGLRHAAQCKAPSHMQCPTFQRYLNLASKRPRRLAKGGAKTPNA